MLTFLRTQQHVSYTQKALSEITPALRMFSEDEGLGAHGRAATIRREES